MPCFLSSHIVGSSNLSSLPILSCRGRLFALGCGLLRIVKRSGFTPGLSAIGIRLSKDPAGGQWQSTSTG